MLVKKTQSIHNKSLLLSNIIIRKDDWKLVIFFDKCKYEFPILLTIITYLPHVEKNIAAWTYKTPSVVTQLYIIL